MISLTDQSLLPQVRLPRNNGGDLVFQGVMLARGEGVHCAGNARKHLAMALYKSRTGKYVLATRETVFLSWRKPLQSRNALCFSCLEDVREYLEKEFSGFDTMLDAYAQTPRTGAGGASWFGCVPPARGEHCGRDCSRCAEVSNCAGHSFIAAGRSYPRRSCP